MIPNVELGVKLVVQPTQEPILNIRTRTLEANARLAVPVIPDHPFPERSLISQRLL